MAGISYKWHQFPPDVIRQAVWLYFRFTLSLRDVEEILAERGIEVSFETVRCWARKFGQSFARNLRRRRPCLLKKTIRVRFFATRSCVA
jgi:putative transposase